MHIPLHDQMNTEEQILERLKRIEAKLDQCIAMNNETRMTCDRIMQEIMALKAGPNITNEIKKDLEEENRLESRKVKIQRAREEKELILDKISKLSRKKEILKNDYFKANISERPSITKEIDILEKELEGLQKELQKTIEYQQSVMGC
jgi:hypothetical protein